MARRHRGRVRLSFLASAAGVLASFLLLAALVAGFKSAGLAVGWGFQFQQPLFLSAMALLVTVFAANLWGFFEVPLPGFAGALASASNRPRAPGGFLHRRLGHLARHPLHRPLPRDRAGLRAGRRAGRDLRHLPGARPWARRPLSAAGRRPLAGPPSAAAGALDGLAEAGAGLRLAGHRPLASRGAGGPDRRQGEPADGRRAGGASSHPHLAPPGAR